MRNATIAAALCAMALQFHAESRLVVVDVSVRSQSGEAVTNLGREAFTVFENGRPQPISIFLGENVPVSVGLVIDNSGSMRDRRPKVEAAALAFVRASNPMDEILVINFADRPRLDVPFTTDAAALDAGIAAGNAIGGTALRDAIAVGEAHLVQHARHDRRILLLLTDGNDNASMVSRDQVKKTAAAHGISIYAIGLPPGDRSPAGRGRHELDDLADSTGGLVRHLESLDDADAAATEIARQIRQQYTLGYVPANLDFDGSYRRIRVAVKTPGVTVRTRGGYYATPENMRKEK